MADQRFDVAIIGAGIVGTSIAYHLAMLGCTNVAVIDKEPTPGTGSTAKAAGGIRAQFSSEINIELSKISIERFERFAEEMGVEVEFFQVGYLWIATKPGEMKLFEKNAAVQEKLGLTIERLDAAGVAAKAPYVRTDDVVGGVFHARDGYASPADYVMGYHKRAKEKGVAFLLGEEVLGREGTTLRTGSGAISAQKVVIATGAYSGKLGEIFGFEVPIKPIRRQCFVTEPLPELPHPIPMTVDFSTGVYLHSESGGVLVGKAEDEPPGFNETADFGFVERVAEQAVARVPLLEKARPKTSWAGLYAVTPDNHPVLGEVSDGVYIASGFSGHGVMHAPATGLLMAELLVTGRPSIDISCLRLSRFKEGQPIQETHVI